MCHCQATVTVAYPTNMVEAEFHLCHSALDRVRVAFPLNTNGAPHRTTAFINYYTNNWSRTFCLHQQPPILPPSKSTSKTSRKAKFPPKRTDFMREPNTPDGKKNNTMFSVAGPVVSAFHDRGAAATAWDFKPAVPSPLSSSPIRPTSPLSPISDNTAARRQTQSSPIPAPKFKYASRPARPNPVVRKREDAQESRRKMFLQNVRQRADDKTYQRRDMEGTVSDR